MRTSGRGTSSLLRFFTTVAILAVSAACGKKGPPLAPLSMAPEAPRTVTARRLGDTVYLQLTVPDKGMSGRGEFSVDHIDVYAVTIGPGIPTPPNRDLLKPEHVVGKIPVQPPLDEETEADPADARPLPGQVVTFTEKLSDDKLVPQVITKPPPPEKPRKPSSKAPSQTPGPAAGAPGAPPAPAGAEVLTRVYVLMGVPKKGRGTMPSPRMTVPLLQAPGAPRPSAPTADETSVTVAWNPPPSTTDEAPGVLYNVYSAPSAGAAAPADAAHVSAPTPLNDKPIAEQTFVHSGAEAGKEQCFVVRSVAAVGNALIESDPSSPVCITPKDTFPPGAPKGLAAVASEGVINLIWDANGEADLAGYVVLRGEAPGATLQPLFKDPIKDTRYADRATQANVRYVYAIVAVDKAGNRSVLSNKVEEAAR